jgi:polynucleotide 5'-kinase involved in rRNA processing
VHGRYLGIKGNLRQNLDKDPGNGGSFQEIESDEENSSEQEESNSEGEEGDEGEESPQAFDGETWQETTSSKKRKGRELERSSDKRQCMEPPKIAPSATIISSTWWDAVDCIVNEYATFSASIYQPPTVAICGAKNAGKSTFARFLVNSMLNRSSTFQSTFSVVF